MIAPPTLTSSGGIISYPATLVNAGGTQTNLCLTNAITENQTLANLIAYPNPFTSSTTLEFNATETKNISISILDVVGRTVKNIPTKKLQSGENKITIDLTELNNGIYFCQINSVENLQTIKLIKR